MEREMSPEAVAALYVKAHYDRMMQAALFGYKYMIELHALERIVCESAEAPEIAIMEQLLAQAGVRAETLAKIRGEGEVL